MPCLFLCAMHGVALESVIPLNRPLQTPKPRLQTMWRVTMRRNTHYTRIADFSNTSTV